RRRPAALAVLALLVALLARAFILLRGDDTRSYRPVKLDNDPWAYDADRQADFESRAAAGHSHVVYVKSPGGIVATAARREEYPDDVERDAACRGRRAR